jgi:hypothetical protein
LAGDGYLFFRAVPNPGDENLFYLVREAKTGAPAIRHRSTYRHGDGRRDRDRQFPLGEFLAQPPSPAQKALLALIATLVDGPAS